jgi:Leucine Rich Repeat (LRR) protein
MNLFLFAMNRAGTPVFQAKKPEEKGGPSEADQKTIQAIEKLGGSVRQIAQNDDRLEVDFHLQPGSLTDDQLAILKDLKKVIHLHLGNTNITDRGLAQLSGLTTLTELHLEKTKITDAGLKALAHLSELSYLNLYGTGITDAGLANLKGLTKLKHLYLWQTKVTPAGVNDLRKAIPGLDANIGPDLESPKTGPESKEKTDTKK